MSARRRSRPARKRTGCFLKLVAAALILAAVGAGVWFVYKYAIESPRFLLKRITVEGAVVLTEEAIVAVAGVSSEDNLLLLDEATVAARVEAMPYVRRCGVRPAPPDTLVITVAERVAVASLLSDNHIFEVDAEGVPLSELDPHGPHVGALITNLPDQGVVEAGKAITHPALTAALAVWDALRTTSLGEDLTLSEISAPDADDVAVYFDELPFETRWGREDIAGQAQRFEILYRQKGGELECDEYLDLRFNNDVICR